MIIHKNLNMIIHKNLKRNQLVFNTDTLCDVTEDNNIAIPLDVDTEFISTENSRIPFTVQMKPVLEKVENGLIFLHQNADEYIKDDCNYPEIENEVAFIDCIKRYVDNVQLYPRNLIKNKKDKRHKVYFNEKEVKSSCTIIMYAHFATAELFMCFGESLYSDINDKNKYGLDYIKKLCLNKKCYNCIEYSKRLKTSIYSAKSPHPDIPIADSVDLPYFIKIGEHVKKLKFKIVDTNALHGQKSLKTLATTVGLSFESKDLLTDEEKSNIFEVWKNDKLRFEAYAKGDLIIHEILSQNKKQVEKMYQDINIQNYFKEPKLTIGSTVNSYLEAIFLDKFKEKIEPDNLKQLIRFGSCNKFKIDDGTTKLLLSKVMGGRCYSNRPTTSNATGIIVDIDISSAYASIMRSLVYPIGNPVAAGYKRDGCNKYDNLGSWYEKRKGWLVDGLWTVYVTSSEPLKYKQDLIPSWFDFKYPDIATEKDDDDTLDTSFNTKLGKVKILSNEIQNGVVTSDIFEWIMNCKKTQRNELLNKLNVIAYIYYPKITATEKIEKVYQDVIENQNIDEVGNVNYEVLQSGSLDIVSIDRNKKTWMGVDLGDLVINKIMNLRYLEKVNVGVKSPGDLFYKLFGNTVFGDIASPFMSMSNTVVGNQITAKCRLLMWCIEKALNTIQSITDGGQFLIDEVCNSERDYKLGMGEYSEYANKDSRNLKKGLLDGAKSIKILPCTTEVGDYLQNMKIEVAYDDKPTLIIEGGKKWIEAKSLAHIKKSFNFSILHDEVVVPNKDFTEKVIQEGILQLEIKDVYDNGTFHGASNYKLSNISNENLAMRSYRNIEHQAYEMDTYGQIVESDFYKDITPSNFFLSQLKNPKAVIRSKVFIKNEILKLNEWRVKALSDDKNLSLDMGGNIQKIGLLREFSLSQFKFCNYKQFKTIEKEVTSLKRRYGQSYEMFYINDDGTLNYQKMIDDVNKYISNGEYSILKILDPSRHKHRKGYLQHPEWQVYKGLQAKSDIDILDDEDGILLDGL